MKSVEYERKALELIYDAGRPNAHDQPRSAEGSQHKCYINPDIKIEQSVDRDLYKHQQENDHNMDAVVKAEGVTVGQRRVDSIVEGLLPLSFITSYKYLDLFIEWILEAHHEAGELSDLDDEEGFKSKINKMWGLINDDNLTIPSPLDKHSDIFDRLFACYYRLCEVRHAVIHRDDFTVDDGVFRAERQESNSYNHEFTMEELLELAKTVLIVDEVIENDKIELMTAQELKSRLDLLEEMHGEDAYDVTPVWSTEIHHFLEVTSPDSGKWQVDLDQVREKASMTPESDGFLLFLRAIHNQTEITQWVIPSGHLEGEDDIQVTFSGGTWQKYKT